MKYGDIAFATSIGDSQDLGTTALHSPSSSPLCRVDAHTSSAVDSPLSKGGYREKDQVPWLGVL